MYSIFSMKKKQESIAHEIALWMFGTTFSVLGFALVAKLDMTAMAIINTITIPVMPFFIIQAFAYFVPLSLLAAGISMFVPNLRNLGIYLLAFDLSLVAIANLFRSTGPRFDNFALCILVFGVLLFFAHLEDSKQK